jgi:amidase
VFGLKPTWGVVSPKGQALPGSYAYSDMSVIGPLARSAGDLDIALDAMAGPDDIDTTAWKVDLPACGAASLRDFRVAVKLRDTRYEPETAYADRLQALTDALAKQGATVREAEPEIDTARFYEDYITLLRAATSARTPEADVARWREASAAAPGEDVYLDMTVRGSTLPHRDWLPLNNERHRLRRVFAAFFRDWDILLCPAAVSAATPHDHSPERWQRRITVNGKSVPATDNLFWPGYSGFVYLPSMVAPAGVIGSGLPVCYQAVAASGRDRTAIAFSRFVEREIGGFVPPPGFE